MSSYQFVFQCAELAQACQSLQISHIIMNGLTDLFFPPMEHDPPKHDALLGGEVASEQRDAATVSGGRSEITENPLSLAS